MNVPRDPSDRSADGGARAPPDGLRDARLARALAHAPDAQLQPDAAVRSAVLRAAREAVAPLPPRRWWQRLRGRDTEGRAARMPWNAALATVLVAGFVAVLWQGEPVPEAQLDGATPTPQSAPSVQDAAPVSPRPVPVPPAPSAPTAEAPRAAPPDVARKAAPLRADTPPPVPAAPVFPAPAEAAATAEKAESPPPAPPPVLSRPAAPPVLAAPAPAARARALAPPLSGLPNDWTHLRPLAPASAGAVVPRAQSGPLAQWLQSLPEAASFASRNEAVTGGSAGSAGATASASADALTSTPAVTRVELLQEGRVLGVLEIGADVWRYQPADAAEQPRGGRLDAQTAAAWRAEIARLASLPR